MKFFWKDKNLRFRGASQSFLDFYGLQSQDDILGKTDEEIGWRVHPDLSRDNERNVIREGIPTRDVLENCLARGQDRSVIANKLPLYDGNGQICGLLGYFSETDAPETRKERESLSRRDALTGLLNVRGLEEAKYAYQDEYVLRGRNYARLRISIPDFPDINRQYGYDFGDLLLRTVASAILSCCGNAASVGRTWGAQFEALYQFENRETLNALTERIGEISSHIHNVGGVPFTPYLSVEVSIFSKSKGDGGAKP